MSTEQNFAIVCFKFIIKEMCFMGVLELNL